MANKAQIDIMRFSLIFSETNLGLLGNPQPPKVPLGFLGNGNSFADMFDKARQKKSVSLGLTAPWDKAGMHFWEYYLENKSALADTPGSTAWRFLVPFRGKVPVQVKVPSLTSNEGKCLVESFYYPHGFACVVTFTIARTLTLADAVAVAFEIRKDKKLEVEWPSGTKEQLALKAFAAKCLADIRQGALGPSASSGASAVEPFTVFTVLKGKGTKTDLSPLDSKLVRSVLEAVTTWPSVWPKAQLPVFDDKVKLALRAAAAATDTLYARKRGRAVWFPDAFTDTKQRSSLSCYHRNLLVASLQTESLCGLATATVQEINTVGWPGLRVMHRDCATLAAGILGRLYGGDQATYRSLSPRYQIVQNGLEADVNEIRDKSNMAALK